MPRFIVARQLVSGATFAIFFVASLMNLIEGQTTCGCFGEFQVRPLVMVLIDAAALFALTTCDWRRSSEPLKRRMALSPVSVAILAGVALAAHSFSRHGPAKGEIQILETADWPGRAFPFDSNLLGARGSELGKGSWIVLLYHTGCAKCAFEMQRLRALSVKERATGSPHLAAIEIPPYASDHEHPRDDGGLNLLRLRNDRAWFVATPQVIYVRDGQVVRVADHLDGKG